MTLEESIRLRELCYSLFSPKVANAMATAITEASAPDATLEDFAAGTTLLYHLEQARQGDGVSFAYSLVQTRTVAEVLPLFPEPKLVRNE